MGVKNLEPGWHKICDDEYFALPYLSRSMIMDYEKSPRYYEKRHILKTLPSHRSSSMELGTLAHDMLFCDDWKTRWDFADVSSRNTKAFKEMQASSKKTVMLESDLDCATKIVNALKTHPWTSKNFPGGEKEITGIFDWHGTRCKFKVDILMDDKIIDLKTTADSSLYSFGMSSAKYGYIKQAGFYTVGAKAIDGKDREYYIAAVESGEPYEVRVYHIYDGLIDHEVQKLSGQIQTINHATVNGFTWAQSEAEPIWLPTYYE